MQIIPIEQLIPDVIDAWGAPHFDRRKQGISPRRLPEWTRNQVPETMDVVVRMPSGVRLRFKTASQVVGLDFLATNMVTPPAQRRPIPFALEAHGTLQTRTSEKGNVIELDPKSPGKFDLIRGDQDRVLFDNPAGKDATLSLWLPHNAFIELRSLIIDDDASIAPPDPETRLRWWHHGSSISHCMEAEDPALIWPAHAAREADLAVTNLGFGGQCHLDQFIARTLRD
ncbi:MAG: lipase, partial [Proteobacteria bacterium]|nr:lipase [Pseudomonadota bacterium]